MGVRDRVVSERGLVGVWCVNTARSIVRLVSVTRKGNRPPLLIVPNSGTASVKAQRKCTNFIRAQLVAQSKVPRLTVSHRHVVIFAGTCSVTGLLRARELHGRRRSKSVGTDGEVHFPVVTRNRCQPQTRGGLRPQEEIYV